MDSAVIEVLNHLSQEVNNLYGYVAMRGSNYQEPGINSGPCGPFADTFVRRWNERFQGKAHIVFVMCKDSDECWHIVVRLPGGMLFDGGVGVHEEGVYGDKYDLVEMEEYSLETLEKYSYGLDRTYPRFCPEFSLEKIDQLIQDHLNHIPKSLMG